MTSKDKTKVFTPVTAVVRFSDAATEYCNSGMQGLPSKCFKGISLFTRDLTGIWQESDLIGNECILVIRWNPDGTREVTQQCPVGWLDEYGHELALMQSLDAAAQLLTDLSTGGEYTITGRETVHDALPVQE